MAIPIYLAMTAAEISGCEALPEHTAWMSCHFSPSGRGLCNLPEALPEGSLLILDDQTPPEGHDAALIRQQLLEVLKDSRCAGLLLDFQRPENEETARIVSVLSTLPCPVCVSHFYAAALPCPVLLPPCPLTVPLKDHLARWDGREVWLELAPERAAYRIMKNGCEVRPASPENALPFHDKALFCHYGIETEKEHILFTLERTLSDLDALLDTAATAGVTKAVGLYQELHPQTQKPLTFR